MSNKQFIELIWTNKYKLLNNFIFEYQLFNNSQTISSAKLSLEQLKKEFTNKIKCIYFYDLPNIELQYLLSIIYSNLKTFKHLLTNNGNLCILVDDLKFHYIKIICDEIFGKNNFISSIIIETEPQIQQNIFLTNHLYLLIYAKNKNKCEFNLLPRTNEMDNRYKNIDNDPRGVWRSINYTIIQHNPKNIYPIITPSGKIIYPSPGRSWRYSQEKFNELLKDNRIWFGLNEQPIVKFFLSEVKNGIPCKSLWKKDKINLNNLIEYITKIILNHNDIMCVIKIIKY